MILWYVIPALVIAVVLWCYHSVCLCCLQKTWLYGWFMRHIAHLRLSFYHANMTTKKYHRGLAVVEPGDMLLTSDRCALSRFLVPGTHTHAMLYLGRIDGVMMCAEMTHEGYGEIDFAEACFHSSRVVILRCPKWDFNYIARVVTKCRSYKGAKYDIEFDSDAGDGDTFCSQLVWASDVEKRLGVVPSRAWGTGQQVVTPDDLLAAKVEVVWDSDVKPPIMWPGFQ